MLSNDVETAPTQALGCLHKRYHRQDTETLAAIHGDDMEMSCTHEQKMRCGSDLT